MATNSTTVFLSLCSEEQMSVRHELSSVLQSAGMIVVPEENFLKDNAISSSSAQIAKSNCSVHILFPEYLPLADNNSDVSLAKFQFYESKRHLELNPEFKMFIWLSPSLLTSSIDAKQSDFINEVRNNISKNMVFSNASSAIQLVDDIRSAMEVKETIVFEVNSTDIFLISNQLDEIEANEIIDMLTDIVPIENLNIIQDDDIDYSELCKQQIPRSKLAVVYYKYSSDWALPFTQQVWKKIGGAATKTPILLIGDEDPNTNIGKKFVAPKVISMIVAGELIPLEIKVQYDKVVG